MRNITRFFAITALSGTISCLNTRIFARDFSGDCVEFSDTVKKIPSEGTNSLTILKNSPNPFVNYLGEEKAAKFVIKLSDNVLYYYDDSGKPIMAYSVATGKSSTPTSEGYRVVSHVEKYPYKTAPRSTKRRRNPKSYGPRIIILDKVDLQTGEKFVTGQFIHGNNDSTSIGKRVSMGCIRMSNKVINFLSTIVKRGDLVVIKK